MAIKFFNIRSKEVLTADTEEQISALWASSDRGPNVTQGQDFGWRLAPEVVVQMKQIKADMNKLMELATIYRLPLEDVGEKEILQYISSQTRPNSAPHAVDEDYSDEYNQEIRRLEDAGKAKEAEANEPVEASNPEVPEAPTVSKSQERREAIQKDAKIKENG